MNSHARRALAALAAVVPTPATTAVQSRPDRAQETGAAGRVATRRNEIDMIETATLVQSGDRSRSSSRAPTVTVQRTSRHWRAHHRVSA
jgi:hypothetical protein